MGARQDCLREGMQRSPAPKPCPGCARGCGVSPSTHTAAHGSSAPTPAALTLGAQIAAVPPSPCRGCRPLCGHRIRPLLSRSPGPGGLVSAPHLPSAFVAAASLGADFFLVSLATTEPSKIHPPWWHRRRGAGFQPQPGGRWQHTVHV